MDKIPSVSTLLNEQYRMHSQIMHWSNQAMYEGELLAGPGVGSRLLSDIYKGGSELLTQPLLIVDTAGALVHESVDE